MAKLPLSCYFSTLNFLKSCHLMNIDGAPSQPGRMEYGAQVHFIPSLFTSIDTSSSARSRSGSSPFKASSISFSDASTESECSARNRFVTNAVNAFSLSAAK